MNCYHKQEKNKICPECPLELVEVKIFDDCGKFSNSKLTLYNNPHILKFTNASYLIDRQLTYVIPKYIYNEEGIMYEVIIDEIVIKEFQNNSEVDYEIKDATENICAYYLIIPITEEMVVDCDIIFEICKFDLTLKRNCNHECENTCNRCNKDSKNKCYAIWKWIVTENENSM
jgi:hypothetical protein